MPSPSLDELVQYADLDDFTEDEEGVEITFTMRGSHTRRTVFGRDLGEAMEQAREAVLTELTLADLRAEGLQDEDIVRLVATRVVDAALGEEEVWGRGYEAGVADAARNAILAQQAIAASMQQPAMATAAEPFTSGDIVKVGDPSAILAQHPLISVVYAPVAIVQDRDPA